MRTALFLLLLAAAFIGPSMAQSDNYVTGNSAQTAIPQTGDMSKYSNNYQEKAYPYEYCQKCNEKHYADGYCDKCGKKSRMFEYCPKCSMTYEV